MPPEAVADSQVLDADATDASPDGGLGAPEREGAGGATCRRPSVAVVAASLDILGGQGVQAQALIDHLRGEGYAIRLVPINPRFPRSLRWIRRVPYLRTLVNELCYLAELRALSRVDVVHVYSASYFSFLLGPVPAMLLARLLGKRVILNYHSGEAEDHLKRWGLMVHPWLRLAHEIVVPSVYLRGVFARYGHDAQVIHNVVNASAFHYRERVEPALRLLSARNLEPHYRVDIVIRAFAIVKLRHPEATLVVAGSGSDERRLKALVASLAIAGVRFAGRFDPADAPALYESADIFVNASVVDNQPVSILEAFASGIPVISTGCGDIPAMLRGGAAGILVGPDDPRALADAIEALVLRRGLAVRLARRARQSLDRFRWEEIRGQWQAVYRGSRS